MRAILCLAACLAAAPSTAGPGLGLPHLRGVVPPVQVGPLLHVPASVHVVVPPVNLEVRLPQVPALGVVVDQGGTLSVSVPALPALKLDSLLQPDPALAILPLHEMQGAPSLDAGSGHRLQLCR